VRGKIDRDDQAGGNAFLEPFVTEIKVLGSASGGAHLIERDSNSSLIVL
jgi:hypothetical protein